MTRTTFDNLSIESLEYLREFLANRMTSLEFNGYVMDKFLCTEEEAEEKTLEEIFPTDELFDIINSMEFSTVLQGMREDEEDWDLETEELIKDSDSAFKII